MAKTLRVPVRWRRCKYLDCANVPDWHELTIDGMQEALAHVSKDGGHWVWAIFWPTRVNAQSTGTEKTMRAAKAAAEKALNIEVDES